MILVADPPSRRLRQLALSHGVGVPRWQGQIDVARMPQAAVARPLSNMTSQCVVGVTPCWGDWPRVLINVLY